MIQDFKNHFISILAGADPSYPKNRWDLLLEHAEVTLNISRPSRLNPKVSAYTLINGNFDFDKTPLAPASTKTIVHDRVDERASWAEHGSRGYYVGPALDHFRCYRNWMVKTNAIRVSNMVEFSPTKCGNPQLQPEDRINILMKDLVSILSNSTKSIPSITYGTELNNALRTIQRLICRDKNCE